MRASQAAACHDIPTKEFAITINTWTILTVADGREFAVRSLNGVTGVALLSPQRITVQLDLFDSKTGTHIIDVSNVIRGDLDAFAVFADDHLELTHDANLVDID